MFWKKPRAPDAEFGALICELIDIKLEGVNFTIDELRERCDKRHKEVTARMSAVQRELRRVKQGKK